MDEIIVLDGKPFAVAPLTVKQLRELLPKLKSPVAPEMMAVAISLAHLNAVGGSAQENSANGASAAEIEAAFKFVARLSGLSRKDEDAAAVPLTSAPPSSVRIGTIDYPIPSLSVEQLEAIRALPTTGETLDIYVRDVHAMLSPTYPEVTRELLEHLDLPRILAVLDNLGAQMEFAKLSFRAPSGRA